MLATDEARHAEDEALESLRALVVGPEQRQLQQLQARIEDPISRARDIATFLPQALVARGEDPELARALTPPVERAITASVQRNPHPLAEALFPVMGPAIRRAVTAALAGMVESINSAIEHSLSWRSLRWRVTAWRTGKSFAEVVLANTLLYRVDQVFLIDRRTGLLLQHVTRTADVEDADMVSGMLTAIRDFVHDSFRASGEESLDAMQVGEVSVWIEQGPRAILAAVIRGTAPRELRRTLQEALETIHLQQAAALERFDGDAAPFAAVRPALDACLLTAYRSEPQRRNWTARLLFAVLVLVLIAWAGVWLRDRMRWTRYLDALRIEPGIVMTASGSRGGRYFVDGLRDPLARDPRDLLFQTGLDPQRVTGRWGAYQALEPRFVVERARALLRPPQQVTLSFEAGTLRARGTASLDWIARTLQSAPFIGGVTRIDVDAVTADAIRALNARLADRALLFNDGSVELVDGQQPLLREIMADLRDLDALARSAGPFRVEVAGHTDAHGGDATNIPLSRARADRTIALLDPSRFPSLEFVPTGAGSQHPVATGTAEADLQRNRRVVLAVASTMPRGERPTSR